jgi:hypothetical protein
MSIIIARQPGRLVVAADIADADLADDASMRGKVAQIWI